MFLLILKRRERGRGGCFLCFYSFVFNNCVCLFSVGFGGIFGTFQLNFEALGADLETVHGLDGCLRTHGVVV